jgi:hypothetical protein
MLHEGHALSGLAATVLLLVVAFSGCGGAHSQARTSPEPDRSREHTTTAAATPTPWHLYVVATPPPFDLSAVRCCMNTEVQPECHLKGASPTKADSDRCVGALWKRYLPGGRYSWAFTGRDHARWKAVFVGAYDDSLPTLCIWVEPRRHELVSLYAYPIPC